MTVTPVFQVSKLRVEYARGRTKVRAVRDVDLEIYQGETLALVGESGCGKSSLGRALLRIEPAASGELRFLGRDIGRLRGAKLRHARADMQLVFQDPFSSLNPRRTVASIVAAPLRHVRGLGRRPARERALAMLERVGLGAEAADRKSGEFSGGQRQRIGIARALVLHPRFVVCDEPVSALDVSVQAQIVNLLRDLQIELGLTYLFIAHDLGVVKHISTRVAVMYLGKIVELAEKRALYAAPRHPYTQGLIAAVPVSHPVARRRRERITGDIPSALHPPSGCRFHTRCPHVMPICREQEPKMTQPVPGHQVACHLVGGG